ncbi:MAG: GNAT family N-acetyltransferase, partial [Cyanobacteria bacterium J06623_1]
MSINPQAPIAIELATSIAEIELCFPVIVQLRPHLQANNFVDRIQTQMKTGYHLAYIQAPEVVGVAGFNLGNNLAWGKYLYIADLV